MDSHAKYQFVIFFLCFICTMSRHALLEGWAMALPHVHSDLHFSTTWIGALDMFFLFMYALGNMIAGAIGDSYSRVIVVSLGMIVSSGFWGIVWILVMSSVDQPAFYLPIFGIMGCLQGGIYPGTVVIMGNFFPQESRGKILGIWSSCAAVGNILGSQFSAAAMSLGFSWKEYLIVLILNLCLVGCIFWIFAKDQAVKNQHLPKKKRISALQALKIPKVVPYALTFCCLKMLNYGLLMWLPYFLKEDQDLREEIVAALAGLFDVGGVIGSITLGWISDKWFDRVITAMIACLIPIPALGIFRSITPDVYWIFFIIIPILGFALGGGTAFISAVVAADLGQEQSDEPEESKSTIAGIMDGAGGFGAGLGQIIIGGLQNVSWSAVFIYMILVGCLALCCISPLVFQYIKKRKREKLVELEENRENSIQVSLSVD